jgi:tRNA threonylcarbamoyl adenosine modification protein (Sua5/YciO/YrdC/YwlC family)
MQTKILKLDGGPGDADTIAMAARWVSEGALVAFPTETVYGLASIAASEPLARLDAVKSRDPDKRYSLHIAAPADLDRYIQAVNPRCRRLILRGWPGPITLVFTLSENQLAHQRLVLGDPWFSCLYRSDTLGVRCPANPIATQLLAAIPHPVVAPSANLSGRPPATTAAEALQSLDGLIDIVLDADDLPAGRCRYAKSSTVLGVTPVGFDVLREGVCSRSDIEDLSLTRILFVCTGNTCRSPMAEIFAQKWLAEKFNCEIDTIDQFGYKVSSAGVMASSELPASAEAVEVARKNGLDLSAHRSRPLDVALIRSCDWIFALGRSHRDRVLSICPDAADRCRLLDESGDIPDPIGADLDTYRRTAERIRRALEIRLKEIVE